MPHASGSGWREHYLPKQLESTKATAETPVTCATPDFLLGLVPTSQRLYPRMCGARLQCLTRCPGRSGSHVGVLVQLIWQLLDRHRKALLHLQGRCQAAGFLTFITLRKPCCQHWSHCWGNTSRRCVLRVKWSYGVALSINRPEVDPLLS